LLILLSSDMCNNALICFDALPFNDLDFYDNLFIDETKRIIFILDLNYADLDITQKLIFVIFFVCCFDEDISSSL